MEEHTAGRLSMDPKLGNGGNCRGALRKRTVAYVVGALQLLAILLLAGSARAAAPVTIASQGKGAGQVENPRGTAVDQSSGDLYVADRNNFRIDKFDSEGNFLLAWGYGVADGISAELQTCGPEANPPTRRCFGPNLSSNHGPGNVIPESVAVEQSTGDVYVADTTNRRVTKFGPAGEFLFMVGKNVNASGVTQTEKNICTATDVEVDHDICGQGVEGNGATEFFSSPTTVVVDSSSHVWVGDTSRVIQFDSSGAYISQAPLTGAGRTNGFGIDGVSGDFYVKSASRTGVRRYAPSGSPVNTLTEVGTPLDNTPGLPEALAVDSTGNVYIGDKTSPYRFKRFNPLGEQTSQFGAGQVLGSPGAGGANNPLAIDNGAGALYVASSQGAASSFVQRFSLPGPGPLIEGQHVEDLLPTTVTLAADLNPEGHETTYHFEYGTSESYGQSSPTATLTGTGFEEEAVEAGLTELTPSTTYHFRLVAINHCNAAEPAEECTVDGPDASFTTPPAVGIDAEWATDVASTSATFRAELNPLGVDASWWLEYGVDESYGHSTAPADLGSGIGDVLVGVGVTGLEPGTTYHYRFAAADERDGVPYTVHGEDRTILTPIGGLGFQLADARAWEMVSPPDKLGGRIVAPWQGIDKASQSGDALTYVTEGPIGETEGNRILEPSQSLAARGSAGWSSSDISPAHETSSPVSTGAEYRLFSDDLSRAAVEPKGLPADGPGLLSDEASERSPYLRENLNAHWRPLVTGKEGFANVPPGTKFGGEPGSQLTEARPPVRIGGASPDLSHIAIETQPALSSDTEGVHFEAEGGVNRTLLYAWSAGALHLISRLPAAEGGTVALGGIGTGKELLGGKESVRHAVSSDGRYVYWSRLEPGGIAIGLYVRNVDAGETVRLDVPQPGAIGGSGRPAFQGASVDGTRAFFTDSQHLTEDAGETGADLYECELVQEAGATKCMLRDLTPETSGEPADVQGIVSAISESGDDVYFVANGVLAPGASSGNCTEGLLADATCNLYHAHYDGSGWSIHFIATLSTQDSPDWGITETINFLTTAHLIASISPSGRYFAFMSNRSLTGYDNRDAAGGQPDEEVFRYDSLTDELTCVSCNPSGARPSGAFEKAHPYQLPTDPLELPLWEQRWLGAVLPSPQWPELSYPAYYQPRSVFDDGRVLFDAFDSLVPADSNGTADAYLYEPHGAGTCTASSLDAGTVQAEDGGCVSLLSSGTSARESVVLDSSASGDDVFILTAAQLSVLDEDSEYDIYDARVNGVTAQRELDTECLGEACQPAAIAPDIVTPASSTFAGPGNLRPKPAKHCAKHKRAVRRKGSVRCVPRKHGRHQRRAPR